MTADQSTAPLETPMSELSGSKSPALHDVAPYPGMNGTTPVDARTMCAHYAAFALMHHTLACDLLDTKDREGIRWSTNLSILSYGIAHLLRSMTEIEGLGDQAALELWQDQHHPGSLGPDLRALLADADVDPEAVVKVAEEVARRHREKSAPATPALSPEHREGLSRILRSALTDYGVGEDRSAHVLADFESRVDGWVGGSYTPLPLGEEA